PASTPAPEAPAPEPAGTDAAAGGVEAEAGAEARDTETGTDADAGGAAAEPSPATALIPPVAPPMPGVPLPTRTVVEPPTLDAYSLRLVVTRKLYDRGTLVRNSPSLADLAPEGALRLNPHDFDQLGLAPGDRVRVTSSRGHITCPARPDPGVPRGCAALQANAPGARANVLVDASTPVTDIRVERP
ncbi:MAG TPA: molybdopterin dinucleotide binding domain-containing protein, partial [Acidimicrobiales bacterium]